MTDGRKTKKAHYSAFRGLRRYMPVGIPYQAGGALSAGHMVDIAHHRCAGGRRDCRLARLETQKRLMVGGVCL